MRMKAIFKKAAVLTLSALSLLALTLAVGCGKDGKKPSEKPDDNPSNPPDSVVTDATPSLQIDYKTLTVYKAYDNAMTAVFKLGDEEQAIDGNEVVWSSSREAVATVEKGVVTGTGVGEAEITARYVYDGTEYADAVSVTVKEIAMYLVNLKNDVLASAVTYAGENNGDCISSEMTVTRILNDGETAADISGLRFTSSDEAIARVADGKVIAGSKTGKATITVSDETATGEFEVEVYSAIKNKFDLDMLALAYARGTHTADWGENARYLLVNDIDYAGNVFIPIAAHTGRNHSYSMIGLQWKTLLAENNPYGVSYADFVKTGLNGAFTLDSMAATTFRGIFDGNGYSIKNAKLMLDASVGFREGEGKDPVFTTNFIGIMGNGSVLRNIALKNFDVQHGTEIGYVFNTAIDGGLDKLGENAGVVEVDMGSYYEFNCFGLFGGGEGKLENVYAELKGEMDKSMVASGFGQYIFGHWRGNTTMTNCVFADNFTDRDPSTDVNTTAMTIGSAASFEAENLVVVSSLALSGTVSGRYYKANDEQAFKNAVESGAFSLDGFDDDTWDKSAGVPILK